MTTEQLWSDTVIDRVAELCGNRSIPYGYAIGQRSDLVDLLREEAKKRLAVTGSPTLIYQALSNHTDTNELDLERARAFWNDVKWGLTVEEFLGELRDRILEFQNPFRRIPAEIQSTEEMLGINDAVDPHAPVSTY